MIYDFNKTQEQNLTELILEHNPAFASMIPPNVTPFRFTPPEVLNDGRVAVTTELLVNVPDVVKGTAVFKYPRLDLSVVFENVGASSELGTAVYYPDEIKEVLEDSIDVFPQVYNNWYRFSHATGNPYPARPSELTEWRYDPVDDLVESTINSSSYIGFISDDFVGDYVFDTIVTANHSDDDEICMLLGAFKQGDIDDREHTLSLLFSSGGNYGTISLIHDFKNNQKTRHVLDSTRPPENPNDKWSRIAWNTRYGHGKVIKEGSVLKIWAILSEIPEGYGDIYDRIRRLQRTVSIYTEEDFIARKYKYFEVDLATWAPIFAGETRFGYAQFSQPFARFWNIRRPGDVPEMPSLLTSHFKDTYGVNITGQGVSLDNAGLGSFKLKFDTLTYTGELVLLPNT